MRDRRSADRQTAIQRGHRLRPQAGPVSSIDQPWRIMSIGMRMGLPVLIKSRLRITRSITLGRANDGAIYCFRLRRTKRFQSPFQALADESRGSFWRRASPQARACFGQSSPTPNRRARYKPPPQLGLLPTERCRRRTLQAQPAIVKPDEHCGRFFIIVDLTNPSISA